MLLLSFILLSSLMLMFPASSATPFFSLFSVTNDHVTASPPSTNILSAPSSMLHCAIACGRQPTCGSVSLHSDGLCHLHHIRAACTVSGTGLTLRPQAGGRFGRSCPLTCLQLKRRWPGSPSGVYRLPAVPVPVYCDQEYNGGGWTLMVTSASKKWTVEQVTRRNDQQPSLSEDYSILEFGDSVLALGTGDRFLYRLEGDAGSDRLQWGGIWSTWRGVALVQHSPVVRTIMKELFSGWKPDSGAIENRLPWVNTGYFPNATTQRFLLTTSADSFFWGNIIANGSGDRRWIKPENRQGGTILYWIREEE